MAAGDLAPTEPEPNGATPTAAPVRASLARNTTALFVSQALSWVLALVGTSIQPRFLGPEAIGQLRLATAIWAIGAVIFAFGTTTVVTVELARDHRQGRLVGRAIGIELALLVVVAAGIVAYSMIAGYGNDLIVVILLTGIVTGLGAIGGPIQAGYAGLEQMTRKSVADITSKVISTAVLVAVLVAGFGVNVVIATSVVGPILAFFILAPHLRRLLGPGAMRPRLDGGRSLLRMGWPFLVNDAVLVLYLQVDTVIISLLATETEIGWYSTADTLFGALLFVPTILTTSLFPVLARLGREDHAELARLVRRSFGFVMLLAVPMGLGTLAIATPVCRLIFGDQFLESGAVLGTYGVVLLLSFPTVLLGRIALATGRARVWAQLMMIATVVSVPVDLVLVPWTHRRYDNGAIGGALAYLVTETIILVPAVKLVAPQLLDRAVVVRLLKTLGAGGVMLAVAWSLREQFLLLPIAAGVAVYTVLVLVTRILDAEEIRIVKRGWNKVRRRMTAAGG